MKAVIFDMDGVIYDSSPYVWKARNIYLKKYGVKITSQEISKLLGKSLRDQLSYINKKYGLSISYEDFSRKTREIQVKLMKNKLKPKSGVEKLIYDLKKHKIKIAIASSNMRKFIIEDLKIMKLKDKFKVITSVEEVERHKPAPDIFLITAKKLKVKPENCLVIEDAVNGLQAAKKAGMKAVAVLTKFHKKEEFKDVDLVVRSIKNLNYYKLRNLF